MNISAYLNRIMKLVLLVSVLALFLTSCDSVIYDDEGDCSVNYRIRFRYDMNMKFADAFSNAVTSVTLYAFDKDGILVYQKSEQGAALSEPDYAMIVDLLPGEYDFIAWCGLGDGESFTVPAAIVGQTRKEELICSMNRLHEADGAHIREDLCPLFHGSMTAQMPDEPGVHTYVVPLTKNTNNVRIVLQHLSGEDVNVSDFNFSITDDNGLISSDNWLLDDEMLVYHPWRTAQGEAGIETESRATTTISAAIAELTVGRLETTHRPILTITNAETGDKVLSIPLIDYALLVKGYYNRDMSDQEYLDRQDEYNMTFFLDEYGRWISTSIIINSWRVVLNPTPLE